MPGSSIICSNTTGVRDRTSPACRSLVAAHVLSGGQHAAYSDLLLSAVPMYGPWRLLGLPADTAFQLFFLTTTSLNFWSAYLYFVRCLRLPPVAAAAAAFLFAFASNRQVQMHHAQLQVHVYTSFVVYAVHRLVEATLPERGGQASCLPCWCWAVIMPLAAVAQLYASFYLGWFLGLGLLLVGLWSLILRVHADRSYWRRCAETGPDCWPVHYLRRQRQSGWRGTTLRPSVRSAHNPHALAWAVPLPLQWLNRGPDGWFSFTQLAVRAGWPASDPWPAEEWALGIGPLTTLLVLCGLWPERRRPLVGLVLAATLTTLLICTTSCPAMRQGPTAGLALSSAGHATGPRRRRRARARSGRPRPAAAVRSRTGPDSASPVDGALHSAASFVSSNRDSDPSRSTRPSHAHASAGFRNAFRRGRRHSSSSAWVARNRPVPRRSTACGRLSPAMYRPSTATPACSRPAGG